MLLEHERYCDEVVTQADLLGELLRGADLATAVPTCPEWTLADLLDHVTGNLREMTLAVRRSRRGRAPSTSAPERPTSAPASAGTVEVLSIEAANLAAALRIAGRGRCARVWGIDATTAEWARRAANDLLIHRADAALALGAPVRISVDQATDALDELLELVAGPPLPTGAERRIVLRATDNDPVWVVTPDGGSFRWRRAHVPGDTPAVGSVAELRGPLTALLLVIYRRLAVGAEGTEVDGDAALLDPWLAGLTLG